jgi:hypothetical protein
VEDFDESEAEPEQPSEGETEAPAAGEEETKAPDAQAPITREGLRRRARTGLDIDSTRLLLQFLLGSDL